MNDGHRRKRIREKHGTVLNVCGLVKLKPIVFLRTEPLWNT